MSSSSSGVNARSRAVLCAVAVGTAVAAASPAAPAASIDSFSGTCTGLEGTASWPEQPMTVVPVDMLLRARLGGGECSGTLNGREVRGLPAVARAGLRGLQSCGGGITSGRFSFRLAGRRITGDMTYRRFGSRVTAYWEGDGGGVALVVVHARIGVVAEDHPLADLPVVGPAISDPVSSEEALRRCAAEGISEMPILLDQLVTVPTLSG